MSSLPSVYNFPNRLSDEEDLSLPGAPGRVRVVGFPVAFDYERQRWFADLTIDTDSMAYTPFLRLVFARFQPFALVDAKLSPAVLVDYIQLTPQRTAVVTADPYRLRALKVTVSGPAPSGPEPVITGPQPTNLVNVPTRVMVTLQRRKQGIQSDLDWEDAPTGTAVILPGVVANPSDLLRWTGTVEFAAPPEAGQYRLLIREYEYLSANYTTVTGRGRRPPREQPRRLIYAETIAIDTALIGPPASLPGTEV